MKRIRVYQTGPPEMMKLEEGEEPCPSAGQILVKILAVGVNPVDTYVRAGTYGYSPALPYTPGADAAGVVEAAGEGVRRFSIGDRVYAGRCLSGSYAQKGLFDEAQVHPLPENLSFAQGACLGIPYATAYRALFQKAKAKPGETILIHGASGGVGLATVQLARQAKLTVIGTAGSDLGRKLVQKEGAHQVLDHHDAGHFEEVKKLTQGRGADIILEMLANENLGRDLKILAPFGRLVVIGSRGLAQVEPRDAMQGDLTILGMVLKNTPADEFQKIHEDLAAGLKGGTLRPVVGKELPLAQAAQAHRAVMTPPAYGNIVLIP